MKKLIAAIIAFFKNMDEEQKAALEWCAKNGYVYTQTHGSYGYVSAVY